jgi:hypothetical protein
MILPILVNNKFKENRHAFNAMMIIEHLKFNIQISINFCEVMVDP